MMPDDLVKQCAVSMRAGVDFPTLWNSVIKPHPSVVGVPVQRIDDNRRPYIEIPLLRGDWLVVDFDTKTVRWRS